MKKVLLSLFTVLFSASLFAIPAYNGWQTKVQPNGEEITVRLVGDEYYSYWETKDGKIAIEQKDGSFVKSQELIPSSEQFRALRAERMNSRRVHKAIGITPNLAPRGVVLLVNFADVVMKDGHTKEVFDNLCNAPKGECTSNKHQGVNYGSAAQFFADQSNGTYRPQFDVFGPITLPHEVAYYGEEGYSETTNRIESDLYLADFVIDAVLAADDAGCDFSQYDSDNDDIVDFVYIIYAGMSQAAGGGSETIWPHNSYLSSNLYCQYFHEKYDEYYCDSEECILPILDGKGINNYACSSELYDDKEMAGIGTLCHEFSHVMGLPDYYDTMYGANWDGCITPENWDLMALGCYNGDMHCPPNYNPWSKYFFGWIDPVNPGQESTSGTLYPNGTTDYNVYQINASGSKVDATTSGLSYYVECRQKSGWDTFIPAAGMAIWKCDFDANTWIYNKVNNTDGDPRFTLVCSSGSILGKRNAAGNVFPNGKVNSWTDGDGNHLTDITKNDNIVSFQYNYDNTPVEPIWTDWAYYDNGTRHVSKGYEDGGLFYWGIKFPANTLANNTLTKVGIYEEASNNTQPISIYVFSGGIIPVVANCIYFEIVEPAGIDGFHEITLAEPVPYDPKENLWIILSEKGAPFPAHASEYNGACQTNWISLNGYTWEELTDTEDNNILLSWMLRAFTITTSEDTGIENANVETNTVKMIQNGQLLIIRGNEKYNILGQKIQ